MTVSLGMGAATWWSFRLSFALAAVAELVWLRMLHDNNSLRLSAKLYHVRISSLLKKMLRCELDRSHLITSNQ